MKKPMATKHPIDTRPVRPMATRNSDSKLLWMSVILFAGTIPIMFDWI